MKSLGKILIVIGLVIIAWSTYIFFKYVGLGGNNSYTPYTAVAGLILIAVGFRLTKK